MSHVPDTVVGLGGGLATFHGFVLAPSPKIILPLAIELDSPGTIIFRQERCGLRGRDFTMHQFRTMVGNSVPKSF